MRLELYQREYKNDAANKPGRLVAAYEGTKESLKNEIEYRKLQGLYELKITDQEAKK